MRRGHREETDSGPATVPYLSYATFPPQKSLHRQRAPSSDRPPRPVGRCASRTSQAVPAEAIWQLQAASSSKTKVLYLLPPRRRLVTLLSARRDVDRLCDAARFQRATSCHDSLRREVWILLQPPIGRCFVLGRAIEELTAKARVIPSDLPKTHLTETVLVTVRPPETETRSLTRTGW